MFRLRLSHYPPANPDTDQYGIAPHTDTSFLTLLAQDQEGLVVSSPSGRWTRVPNCPSLLVVNITLHYITGGHYITLLVVNIILHYITGGHYITLLVVNTILHYITGGHSLHYWWSLHYIAGGEHRGAA